MEQEPSRVSDQGSVLDRVSAPRLRLLGAVSVRDQNEEEIPVPRGKKILGLLTILGLSVGRPVRRSHIADMLWGQSRDMLARTNLRQCLRALRAAFSEAGLDVLDVDHDTITLRAVWVDVRHITDAWSAGGVPDTEVLALASRGPLLQHADGINPVFDSWLASERVRLRGQIETLSERYLATVETNEGPDALLSAARRFLDLDRAHEGAWRALMRAQLARGECGLALRAYEDCKTALREELDAMPSGETEALASTARVGGDRQALVKVPPSGLFIPFVAREQTGVRVAVLSPRVLGPDVEEYMPFAVAEDLSDALARFRWLMVLAPASLSGLPDLSHDSISLYQALGLDYLVTGTMMRVPRAGLRLTVRLLNP